MQSSFDQLSQCLTTKPAFSSSTSHQNALDFAANLNFQGFIDWRLPSVDIDGNGIIIDCRFSSEIECRDNELGYMWRHNLGGEPFGDPIIGDQGPFQNVQILHWSNTFLETDPSLAWALSFRFGTAQRIALDVIVSSPWAVRDGDVIDTPIPPSLMQLVAGLFSQMWHQHEGANPTFAHWVGSIFVARESRLPK